MKPTLPQRPTGGQTVTGFTPDWIVRLLDCVAYAMDNPQGDGRTILNNAGLLSAKVSPSGTGDGGETEYRGPFKVEYIYDMEKDTYHIGCCDGGNEDGENAGYIRVGSTYQAVPSAWWEPKAGVVYAEVLYDDEEEDYTIDVYFEEELPEDSDPKRWVLRIAEVKEKEDFYEVAQLWADGDITVSGRWVK